MTDEPQYSAMTQIEIVHAMIGFASATRSFYTSLTTEGFTPEEAFKLTLQYVHGMAGGR